MAFCATGSTSSTAEPTDPLKAFALGYGAGWGGAAHRWVSDTGTHVSPRWRPADQRHHRAKLVGNFWSVARGS
jgi:hypothetical protein